MQQNIIYKKIENCVRDTVVDKLRNTSRYSITHNDASNNRCVFGFVNNSYKNNGDFSII